MLAKLFEDRGVELVRTYQLDFGSDMYFMSMLERKRLDAIRAAKIAKNRDIGDPIVSASSYFMKSPPEQYSDAYQAVERTGHLPGKARDRGCRSGRRRS